MLWFKLKLFGVLAWNNIVISVTREPWQCHPEMTMLVARTSNSFDFSSSELFRQTLCLVFLYDLQSVSGFSKKPSSQLSGQWEIIIFIMKLALWLMLACLFTNEADIIWLKINSFRVTLIIKRGNHSIKYNIPVTLTCQVGEKLVLN